MMLLRTEGALKFQFIQVLEKCVSRYCTGISVFSSTAVDVVLPHPKGPKTSRKATPDCRHHKMKSS